ncbi:hypothetical protein A2533_00290 [Candidatus Falkowbacteria bacterium RIFOXYD2_FULL_35_9]|nr:MAG: hypothetical protein A2223_01595 [Candidatus Falkowbacteria bacterium RIFOXYA2_FULL_35_8]OGF46018.1 MAG: hypothetical protein A2533_00290 [Candidatus Falkowbacteria bacterium RIFOXYD2_FULL_35_9]
MKKYLVLITILMLFPLGALKASPIEDGLNLSATTSGLVTEEQTQSEADLLVAEKIGTIIKVFLSIIGIIFLMLIIFGGTLWMTAGGDQTQLTKGKNYIIYAAIGLVMIAGSYAVTDFVIRAFIDQF